MLGFGGEYKISLKVKQQDKLIEESMERLPEWSSYVQSCSEEPDPNIKGRKENIEIGEERNASVVMKEGNCFLLLQRHS